MHLSFCVIVEGDSKLPNLKKLISSVAPYVQSIHVTANGSDTKETKKYCEDNGYDYSFLKWNDDFSAQRNYNFSRVPKETDFILWADSDDVIVGADLLPDIARVSKEKEFDTVFFTYWYGCRFDGEPSHETLKDIELTQERERLIRPLAITWKSRIHETPVPVNGTNHKYSKISYSKEYPIAWLHLGADRNIDQESLNLRMERNKKMLEKQLADERAKGEADPRTILYLMKIYAESDDDKTLTECISLGEEYMQKSGWDAERAVCASLMARCMGLLGDDLKSSTFLHRAIQEYPHDPILYLQLARVYYNLKNFRSMKHWMQVGLSIDVDHGSNSMNNVLEMKILSA